ncbi:MAG: hypothetical protein ACI9E4_000868, partial [Pseudohongiellaceae bacterium]
MANLVRNGRQLSIIQASTKIIKKGYWHENFNA